MQRTCPAVGASARPTRGRDKSASYRKSKAKISDLGEITAKRKCGQKLKMEDLRCDLKLTAPYAERCLERRTQEFLVAG